MTRLSKNAVTVLERRYLARNEASELIETPEGMFRRVADAIAAGDKAVRGAIFQRPVLPRGTGRGIFKGIVGRPGRRADRKKELA